MLCSHSTVSALTTRVEVLVGMGLGTRPVWIVISLVCVVDTARQFVELPASVLERILMRLVSNHRWTRVVALLTDAQERSDDRVALGAAIDVTAYIESNHSLSNPHQRAQHLELLLASGAQVGRGLCEEGGTETGLPVSAGATAARSAPCRPGAEGGNDAAPRRAPHRTGTRQRYVPTVSRVMVKQGKRFGQHQYVCLVMKSTIWKPVDRVRHIYGQKNRSAISGETS